MARAIDSSYLLQHKRKVKFFGLGPDDESWGYAVPVEVIEKAPTLTQPNEPLTCDGCISLGTSYGPCMNCIRSRLRGDMYRRSQEVLKNE